MAENQDTSSGLMPSFVHIFYIPGIFLVGFVLGFRLGALFARAELNKQKKEEME